MYLSQATGLLVLARIVFLLSAFIHLAVTALVTLNIDTTVDEDPKVRAYYYTRWKLVTCWYNLITLVYLPTRLYCEWKSSQGDATTLVNKLKHAADVVFTGILFPVILFSNVTFWIVYHVDIDLLAPRQIFDVYLPFWAQHSLHTVPLFMVMFDLLLTPRQKPSNLKYRMALLLGFSSAYILMVAYYYSKGDMVYKLFDTTSSLGLTLIATCSLIAVLVCFSVQWFVIRYIWGDKSVQKTL